MTTNADVQLREQRNQYGDYTLVPPSDWQPTERFLRFRCTVARFLSWLAWDVIPEVNRRLMPDRPFVDDVRAGTYPGAREL